MAILMCTPRGQENRRLASSTGRSLTTCGNRSTPALRPGDQLPTEPPRAGMTRRERRPANASPDLDGDHRPGPEVDPVTVVEGQPDPGGYLPAIDQSAVLRPGIQDRPAAVRLGEQYCVQPGDTRVGGGACQVDFGFEAPRYAPPSDAHFRPGQPEPALWGISRKLHRRRVGAASRDYVLKVRAIAGHHRRP